MMIFHASPCDNLRITSRFGKRNTGIKGASTNHKGIDIAGGSAIYAVRRGVICLSYWNNVRGWVVVIDHENGYKTLYQHLYEKSPLAIGTRVYAGDRIGTMGNSSATLKIAKHLHMELLEKGVAIDFESSLLDIKGVEEDMTEQELNKRIDERIQAILNGDNKPVSNWASAIWTDAIRNGITDGTRPQGYVTREQCAVMIKRSQYDR